jgi:hypothetical protein
MVAELLAAMASPEEHVVLESGVEGMPAPVVVAEDAGDAGDIGGGQSA